jgi:MarR family transcriptional regulator, organic hydroperoxide resistance regulator
MVEFLSAVWGLYRELDSASARMLRHLGVSGPQRLALRLIEVTPGITAGQLALALDLHRSTVSGLAKRLTSLGLLTRRTDTADRRVVFLALTPAGRKLNARTAVTIETALAALIGARGASWRRSARELLRELSAAVRGAGARSRTATGVRKRAQSASVRGA